MKSINSSEFPKTSFTEVNTCSSVDHGTVGRSGQKLEVAGNYP